MIINDRKKDDYTIRTTPMVMVMMMMMMTLTTTTTTLTTMVIYIFFSIILDAITALNSFHKSTRSGC